MKRGLWIIAILLTMIEAAWADPPVQQQYAIMYFGANVFLHDDTNTPLHVRIASTNTAVLLVRDYWAFSNDTGVVVLYNANGRGWDFTNGVVEGPWTFLEGTVYIGDEGTLLSNGDLDFSGTEGGNLKMAGSSYIVLTDDPQIVTIHTNLVLMGSLETDEINAPTGENLEIGCDEGQLIYMLGGMEIQGEVEAGTNKMSAAGFQGDYFYVGTSGSYIYRGTEANGTNIYYRATNGVTGRINLTYE